MPKESFFVNRVKSVGFALRGVFRLFRTERSIQIQLGIALLVTLAGFYYQISPVEWALQCLCIGLVMGTEGVNTAIEKLADYVQPEYDEKIGRLKDISAGAVLWVSMITVVVGLLVYVPKVFQ